MAWSDAAARRKYHVGNLRAQLLEEARALVEAGGRAQLNLRSLAARAGIAPGSVYHHYENKAELLAELAATGFQELEQTLEQALAEAPQGVRIRTRARAYFGFSRAQPALFGLMFDAGVLGHSKVDEARQKAFEVLERAIGVALPDRDAPEARTKLALAVWACGHGAATLASPETERHDALLEDVIQGLELLFGRR